MASEAEANEAPPKGQWTTGFYDCWDERSQCCYTFWCPCMTFGQIAEIVDTGTMSKDAACCIYYVSSITGTKSLFGGTYRSKLRRLFSLPQEPYSDSFVHCICCLCALTQEYKELKKRGIDPSIGWEGNVEKWKGEGVEAPLVPAMAR